MQLHPFRSPPSTWHPAILAISVHLRRVVRSTSMRLDGHRYVQRTMAPFPHRVHRHTSKLIRHAPGVDLALQQGKVRNLDRAIPHIDGIVIAPGETFSFWRRVGAPTRARGFVEGMELSRGKPRAGVGGGLCQIANMLHWLVLHSPLVVVERHHHSLDVFPDDGRVLPFGSGATVSHNFLDYRVHNPTPMAFQFLLSRTDRQLVGELRSAMPPSVSFHVFEREHRFVTRGDTTFRTNEIWRRAHDVRSGDVLHTERLYRNEARVMYAMTTPG